MKSIGPSHSQSRTATSSSKSAQNLSAKLVSVEKTLKFLEAISPRQWTDAEQRTLFRSALAALPDWQLQKIVAEYRGTINHRVFEFAAALPVPLPKQEYDTRRLTNYSDPEMGKYFFKTARELMFMGLRSAELQQALYWLMKIQYPQWEEAGG